MKPTVGRSIHYYSVKQPTTPLAAIVVAVNDSVISANVMRPDGGQFIASLPIKPHEGETPRDEDNEPGKVTREWWVWPPRE